MTDRPSLRCGSLVFIALSLSVAAATAQVDTSPPASTARVCWIHHSSGSYWTQSYASDPSYGGDLGQALNANNYYITECDYGWTYSGDPYDSGNHTDTVDWANWFNNTTMPYVYANSAHYDWDNTIADPGGGNEIVVFKSCFPNSEVDESIDDEKALYNALLPYFALHTDRLFVLVTPPGETVVSSWTRTQQLCDWLCDEATGWLSGYAENHHHNVAVFDFYTVLSELDAHHRVVGGVVQRVASPTADGVSPYHDGDDHPNSTGNLKATAEFLPLLNYFYNRWTAEMGEITFPACLNFQPPAATAPSGFLRDDGSLFGVRYGWR